MWWLGIDLSSAIWGTFPNEGLYKWSSWDEVGKYCFLWTRGQAWNWKLKDQRGLYLEFPRTCIANNHHMILHWKYAGFCFPLGIQNSVYVKSLFIAVGRNIFLWVFFFCCLKFLLYFSLVSRWWHNVHKFVMV